MRMHAIDAQDVMQGLGVASKLNADWEFLTHLHDIGRRRAEAWLDSTFDRLGVEGTVDLATRYV
jgi:NTE family protein